MNCAIPTAYLGSDTVAMLVALIPGVPTGGSINPAWHKPWGYKSPSPPPYINILALAARFTELEAATIIAMLQKPPFAGVDGKTAQMAVMLRILVSELTAAELLERIGFDDVAARDKSPEAHQRRRQMYQNFLDFIVRGKNLKLFFILLTFLSCLIFLDVFIYRTINGILPLLRRCGCQVHCRSACRGGSSGGRRSQNPRHGSGQRARGRRTRSQKTACCLGPRRRCQRGHLRCAPAAITTCRACQQHGEPSYLFSQRDQRQRGHHIGVRRGPGRHFHAS